MATSSRRSMAVFRLVLAALFLALAIILPLWTGQLKALGKALCPMHLPVLLCGFFCGPWYGLAVGVVAPLLRFALFGMPELISAVGMCVELGAYGVLTGVLYRTFPRKTGYIYLTLILSMLSGRILWGLCRVFFLAVWQIPFGWAAFFAGAFTESTLGIAVQIIVVPLLVMTLEKEVPRLRD